MRHVVYLTGFCCDTGKFTAEREFKTYEEAQQYVREFNEDEANGKFWSDGPSSALL